MVSKKDKFLEKNQREIETLAKKFGAYPTGISKIEIRSFLSQFEDEDLPVALKLLQNVDYYDMGRMTCVARSLGEQVNALNGGNLNNVLFCPMSRNSGNSSDSIQRLLKLTHGGTTPESRQEFVMRCLNNVLDLQGLQASQDHRNIVFVDHFIGSGETIVTTWGGIKQWENQNHQYFVGVLVGYTDAIGFVEEETDHHLRVIAAVEQPPSARAFHDENTVFTTEEKLTLKKYCDKLSIEPPNQYGFQNGQSLIIFSNRSSDNVLPILWYPKKDVWVPLFPRQFA